MGNMLSQVSGLVFFIALVLAMGTVQNFVQKRRDRKRRERRAIARAMRRHPAGKRILL